MAFPSSPYINQEYINPFSGALYVFNGTYWQATIQATIKPDVIVDAKPNLSLQEGNISKKPYIKVDNKYERIVIKSELEVGSDITFNGGNF